MSKAVFCIADSESQAERMVANLKRNGFRNGDISVLFPDKTGCKDLAHEMHTKAPQGALIGMIGAGLTGGCLGWLVGSGIGAPEIVGVFAAAGPVMTALAAAAVAAATGGVIGALIGFGIPQIVAKRYRGKIGVGNILISVHAETGPSARQARKIFVDSGCGDAVITGEAAVPHHRFCAT